MPINLWMSSFVVVVVVCLFVFVVVVVGGGLDFFFFDVLILNSKVCYVWGPQETQMSPRIANSTETHKKSLIFKFNLGLPN